jgi:chitinase
MQKHHWRGVSGLLCICLMTTGAVKAQDGQRKPLDVIAYYAGRSTMVDSFPIEKLTHIIFSFCHLKGDELSVSNANDTMRIRHLVALKSRNPRLKVILSMGGWGGCRTCSDVFRQKKGRKDFARSVRRTLEGFRADGIDLDWEYPALANIPGYPYAPEDKADFTDVVRRLRRDLGRHYEISFAAGGFTAYLEHCIDWKKVMPYVDLVNLMTYDLVNGYDTVSGHHTPLYSTPTHMESIDHAVHLLDSIGVPNEKLAIGAAFYARVFGRVDSISNGLYRNGRFMYGVDFRNFPRLLSTDSGFVYHWDPVAQAPYLYNRQRQLFATFDDTSSIRLKTRYALEHHLGGIMFWELSNDVFGDGLLDAIYEEKQKENH